MKKFRHFLAMVALVLIISIFIASEPCQMVSAAVGQDVKLSKQYLSELKMFYGTSESDARSVCEKEGYTFCPTDLNEGGVVVEKDFFAMDDINVLENKEVHTYLGYKTTDDPDDAITDVTLLDMKYTHYEKIDYQDFLDKHLGDFRDKAAKMMVLANELSKKLEAGSPNAQIVYDSLNMLYMDESKPHDSLQNQLGYYLVNNADITFFEKFLQRGNAMVLNKIINLLCNATADYEADGTTWVDRSKVSEVAIEYANATSAQKNWYDQNLQDGAKAFVSAIRSFRDTYVEAKQLHDAHGNSFGYAELEGMTEENALEKIRAAGTSCRYPEYIDAMKTYTLLDNIPYQTAGETVVSNASLLVDNASTEVSGEETSEGSQEEAVDESQKPAIESQTFSTNLTLAQYIMDLASDDSLEDHLSTVYPIVASMSGAQRVALSLCGFGKFVEGLYQANDYPANRTKAINEVIQKAKDAGFGDGRLYVWTGMDNTLYDKKVVQTDASKEAAACGAEVKNAEDAARRKTQDKLTMALNIVDMTTLIYGGVGTLISLAVGSFWTLGTTLLEGAGLYLLAEMTGMAVITAIGGVLMCALYVLNILCIVVGVVLLLYNIMKAIGIFNIKDAINYDDIPDVVFDARKTSTGTYSVRYDAIRSNSYSFWDRNLDDYADKMYERMRDRTKSNYADVAAYMGFYDRWAVMYYTKSPAAGEPIEVKEGQQPFVTRGDYQPPEGYRPLTLIIGSSAEDVNSVIVGKKQGTPLYVFFPGTPEGKSNGGIVADNGSYVTEVRFSYDDNMQNAINRLKASNFQYYDVNLTPEKGFTYLGYKLGSAANALTDIRVSTSTVNAIPFGNASYGRMGMDGHDTSSYGMTIFATKSKEAGSPIVALSLDNKRRELGSGMEPVCLFSGGNAVDIGTNWKNNILDSGSSDNVGFFTDNMLGNSGSSVYKNSKKNYSYDFISQDDPANGFYLYFQPKEQFKSTDANGKPAQRYIAGFSYFLAGDSNTSDSRFGTNYEFMQTFAKENGFDLLTENGEPFRVMSDEAGEMTMGTTWREVWGYPVDTYNMDMYHSIQNNRIIANWDGGLSPEWNLHGPAYYVYSRLSRHGKIIYHTAMYFGVSYTYNPHRAITGISGLITPYTERSEQIKYSGLKTPAGTFQPCDVSIQGCPIISAGITAGYYNPLTMTFPLYTNYEASQHSDLSWTTDKDMEVLSHYLMTSGPRDGVLPLKEGDIAFSMKENPGQMAGYVPLCDLRTPGDYDHPMNLALDTTNKGSKYLYLYLKAGAGGREENDVAVPQTNVYTAKKYVAAVFCGVGKTPEAAIANLYSNAAGKWAELAETYPEISARPSITELDEIIPVDISSEHPWYTLFRDDTNVKSLKNGEVVYGNDLAHYRWDGHSREEKKTIDEYEKDWKCAYIGVVRIANNEATASAAYGVLKYYSNADNAPAKLNCDGTDCILAGGPVDSPEGKYFLYYSTNSGTASYSAPVTSIDISDDIFINGYNTAFTVSESDRKADHKLPAFDELRMRADEFKYIHLGYERDKLPYYEALYIGVGDTKKDAFIDMVGTTNSYAATDVNCNYNSYSKKWIAIGYRRTSVKGNAIRDIFLYQGEDPPDEISIDGGYVIRTIVYAGNRTKTTVDKTTSEIPYYLVKHNLKSGAENISLNEGNGKGTGLYIYYTTTSFSLDDTKGMEIAPITNLCFSYGDISPRKATADDLAKAFKSSYYGTAQFDASAYANPVWECVLGVSGSPEKWALNAESGTRFSLNQGVRPGLNGNGWGGSDNRVYMYVDRANGSTKYNVRKNAKLPEFGYYSAESTYGIIKQVAE